MKEGMNKMKATYKVPKWAINIFSVYFFPKLIHKFKAVSVKNSNLISYKA